MVKKGIKTHPWLYPFAWLYGLGVSFRNKLFDWGWLQSKSFCVPTICVGNIAVGGTGKTPHTEYLINLLQSEGLHVATLSRGYKRKTKGYVLAQSQSTATQIGDEPYQIKQKFPHIEVAVCESRCHGIEQLLKIQKPEVEVVLLDDAFQHRYVKPGLSILLTDYNRLLCDDVLMPVGLLREPIEAKSRAQIVIVTKCPHDLKPIDYNIVSKQLNLYPYQQLFFSHFVYGSLKPLFAREAATVPSPLPVKQGSHVLLLTGIANPTPLKEELIRRGAQVTLVAYADHHNFSAQDLKQIEAQFSKLPIGKRLIVTTEKDAARLCQHPLLDNQLKPFLYALPITIEILQNQQNTFNQIITDYVRKNSRNSSISPTENAHTS